MISSHPSEIPACVLNKILRKLTLPSPFIVYLHSIPNTLPTPYSPWHTHCGCTSRRVFGFQPVESKAGTWKAPWYCVVKHFDVQGLQSDLTPESQLKGQGTNNEAHPWGPDIQQSPAKVRSLVLRRFSHGQSFFHPSRWQSPYKNYVSELLVPGPFIPIFTRKEKSTPWKSLQVLETSSCHLQENKLSSLHWESTVTTMNLAWWSLCHV